MRRFKRYLSAEIGIEFKACLYFFTMLFFYAMYQIMQGNWYASILVMMEMIFSTYFMGYAQVYLLHNFDEAERLGRREIGGMLLGTSIYTAISYAGAWFDRDPLVTGLFFLWTFLCYICAFLVYKVKRDIDTEQLNEELESFKKQKREARHESGICDRD